jgi:hypothetical protein
VFEYKRGGNKGESPLWRAKGRLAGDRKLSRRRHAGNRPLQRAARQFPVLRFTASKKGTFCKSPANSHFLPNFRENALSGVASLGKTAAFPCTLCRCLGKLVNDAAQDGVVIRKTRDISALIFSTMVSPSDF